VTLAAGETNLTVDAGLVLLTESLTVPTPTEPTNLPDTDQPHLGKPKLFLPDMQNNPVAATADVASEASRPAQKQTPLFLPVLQANQ
jgi:hypothetical protein